MMGIGWTELIILLVLGFLTVVPGVVGLGVLVWLILKNKTSSNSNREQRQYKCPACGIDIPPAATTCPQCGSPTFDDQADVAR